MIVFKKNQTSTWKAGRYDLPITPVVRWLNAKSEWFNLGVQT